MFFCVLRCDKYMVGAGGYRQRRTSFPSHSQLITGGIFEGNLEIKIPASIVNSLGISAFWPAKGATKIVNVVFKKKGKEEGTFEVKLKIQIRGKGTQYRIHDNSGGKLQDLLRMTFLASYARHLEALHRAQNDEIPYNTLAVEPFHEFVDIDFDLPNDRMNWHAHYVVEPTYSHLFRELADNRFLHRVDLKLKGKKLAHSEWESISKKPPKKYVNVIYFLRDDKSKTIYVGQGGPSTGTDRIHQSRPKTMPTPTHYRYDVFPSNLDKKSLDAIEQMQIRAMAFLLENNPTSSKQKRNYVKGFSGYKLTNREIK